MGFFDFLASSTPAGVASSTATAVIGSVFDGVDKLIRDFKLPPEVALDFEKFKTEQLGKLEAIDAADRASARTREVSVQSSSAVVAWTPSILAWFIIITFAGAQYFVFTHPLPVGNEMLIARVLGTLDMAVGILLGYYYGSSSGSRNKDVVITSLTQGK
jgi:hypothetical protein